MKKVLGLDIGTNSIGWSFVELDAEPSEGRILGMGSRIIPMETDLLNNLEQGNSISKTASRRQARGARRLKHRYKIRRNRLIECLILLKWLPNHFKPGGQLPYSEKTLSELRNYLNDDDITEDWAVYYLRKKALKEKIELEELARILLHFNQRRGFKSNRKADQNQQQIEAENEDHEKTGNTKWVEIAKVSGIIATGDQFKNKNQYEVTLSDGRKAFTHRDTFPDWIDKEVEFEFRQRVSKKTTSLNISLPNKTDWVQLKEALSKDIEDKNLHVGEYYLEEIRKNRNYRIRERIIERSRLIHELNSIWNTQARFHPQLTSSNLLPKIAKKLYSNNEQKQKEVEGNSLLHLISTNIIFYQRPLKSQKNSINECSCERRCYLNPITNRTESAGIKVCPVSKPIFQEFRIWKTINNLRIIRHSIELDGEIKTDYDETSVHFPEKLDLIFELFNNKDKISTREILKQLGLSQKTHRLNFPDETEFVGNETRYAISKVFKKNNYDGDKIFEDAPSFEYIWHCIYALDNENVIFNSIKSRLNLPDDICSALSKLPPFKLKYAAYSSKALAKMLPLMRSGKYWSINQIDQSVQSRISKIINAEFDSSINENAREELKHLRNINQFSGLSEYLTKITVYGMQNLSEELDQVNSPEQVVNPIRPNSLNNPIVEQVIHEVLQLVKSIWTQFDRPDEIRIELARDYKKTATERKKIYNQNQKNKEDNERIKAILRELGIGNPNSLSDIEKLKIAEENAKFSGFDDQQKAFFGKGANPTKTEIEKYRLWMNQNCISPYTGRVIQLSKLFSSDYEIEHIIPRSKFFDDSLMNKVIVESWANKEKDKLTAFQYIKKGTQEKGMKLLSPDEYIEHVKKTFTIKKRQRLLEEEIPEGFIERQLNDTRYITRKVKEALLQICPKVYSTIGSVTSELKHKWGLSSLMKKLLEERFLRLEQISNEQLVFNYTGQNGERILQLKGYEKRIDHRHHALDALVIACTRQSHIQYLNTLESKNDKKFNHFQFKNLLKSNKIRDFREPWKGFHEDAVNAMENIIISFKRRIRIINKPRNKYLKFIKNEKGKWIKSYVVQNESSTENPWISIRQSLHKETISGTVKIREYKDIPIKQALDKVNFICNKSIRNKLKNLLKQFDSNSKELLKHLSKNPIIDSAGKSVNKVTIWYLNSYSKNRVVLDKSFDRNKIEKIAEYTSSKPDKGLKNILLQHLGLYDHKPEKAFEGEGLEALAKSYGKAISKVSIKESIGNKFEIRPGNLVEAAKGTNLYFLVYEHMLTKEREFETLRFLDVVEKKKLKLPLAESKEGYHWFTLSPNDLVYVPEPDEDISTIDWDKDRKRLSKRIYKMVSCTGSQCFFIPHLISKPVLEIVELGANNKSERSWDGIMIKKTCIKLKVDRLGNIRPVK